MEAYTYTNHTMQTDGETTFYLSSDGYAHQGGGAKGLPFGANRLKSLLLAISREPMQEQKNTVEEKLGEYRGQEPQRDDITVVGFRPT